MLKKIDWVISPVGQKIIKEEGFIPLWEINSNLYSNLQFYLLVSIQNN